MTHTLPQPSALVIGPKKCGTSWIHAYLAARNDVCLPLHVKETFFYDRYHHRGLQWYRGLFAHYDPAVHKISMEVAPTLFHHSTSIPWLVRHELGDIPIVITLRHPLERAWSHYKHVRRASTRKPLKAAVRDYPEILDASRYGVHVPRWKEVFSEVNVLAFEEMASDRLAFVEQIEKSLSLPAAPPHAHDIEPVNVSRNPRFFHVTYAARSVKKALRSFGLYATVDALKRPALTRIMYKGGGDTVRMSDEDRTFLERELDDQLREWRPDALRKILG